MKIIFCILLSIMSTFSEEERIESMIEIMEPSGLKAAIERKYPTGDPIQIESAHNQFLNALKIEKNLIILVSFPAPTSIKAFDKKGLSENIEVISKEKLTVSGIEVTQDGRIPDFGSSTMLTVGFRLRITSNTVLITVEYEKGESDNIVIPAIITEPSSK